MLLLTLFCADTETVAASGSNDLRLVATGLQMDHLSDVASGHPPAMT